METLNILDLTPIEISNCTYTTDNNTLSIIPSGDAYIVYDITSFLQQNASGKIYLTFDSIQVTIHAQMTITWYYTGGGSSSSSLLNGENTYVSNIPTNDLSQVLLYINILGPLSLTNPKLCISNITSSDKQALLDNSATIPFNILIKQDGEVVKTLNENSIVNLDYEDFRYVDTQSLCIGQFVARKVTGTLDQIYTEFDIEDTEIELRMGISHDDTTTYYSLGNFLVTKPANDDVKEKTTFEALDYTKKFNQVFDGEGLVFPCTALQLAQHVCNQCGVTLATTDFANYNFEIPTNQYVEGDTCRKVMQDIGKLAYSWVRIGWDNKCYIDFTIQNTVDEYNTIDNTQYYDLSVQKEVFGPVNRVVIGMKDVEGENRVIEDQQSIVENGVTEIQLYDSNITYTPELRESAIQAATRLFGLTYIPLELTTIGHPWLNGNDKIEVINMNGDSLYSYAWDRSIVYNGHIKTKLISKADTKTETEYKNYGELETANRRTRIIVDKANQTITSVVSDLYDAVRNASGYTVTVENCIKGALQSLTLYGLINPTLPSTSLYPSTSLFMLPGTFHIKQTYYVDNVAQERLYELPFVYLGYISEEIHDEFHIDKTGKCTINRKVELNSDGTYSPLLSPYVEDCGELVIVCEEGRNTFEFTPYFTAHLDIDYVIKNELTEIYAPTAEVTSQIQQTKHDITLSVEEKTDGAALISKINLTPGEIKLEGTVTANNNFQILEDGSIIARNGSFSGNIYLDDGGEILGGNGLFSCLSFASLGRWSSWSTLGFDVSGIDVQNTDVRRAAVYINAYIPENFVVSQAYIVLETSSVYSSYADASGNHDVVGTPKQLALLKGDGGTTVTYKYYPYSAMEEYTEYSGTEINDAFGPGHYSPIIPSPGEVVTVKSTNIAEYITSGENNPFIISSMIDPRPVIKTYMVSGYTQYNYEEIVKNTGLGRASLYVFGFMKNNSEEE